MYGVRISGIVFNYQYALEHGFIAWIFIGEIVASIKAIFWPLYLITFFKK